MRLQPFSTIKMCRHPRKKENKVPLQDELQHRQISQKNNLRFYCQPSNGTTTELFLGSA